MLKVLAPEYAEGAEESEMREQDMAACHAAYEFYNQDPMQAQRFLVDYLAAMIQFVREAKPEDREKRSIFQKAEALFTAQVGFLEERLLRLDEGDADICNAHIDVCKSRAAQLNGAIIPLATIAPVDESVSDDEDAASTDEDSSVRNSPLSERAALPRTPTRRHTASLTSSALAPSPVFTTALSSHGRAATIAGGAIDFDALGDDGNAG